MYEYNDQLINFVLLKKQEKKKLVESPQLIKINIYKRSSKSDISTRKSRCFPFKNDENII